MTASMPPAVPDLTALPAPVQPTRPLSGRTIAKVGAAVLVVTAITIAGLLWWVNVGGLTGTDLATARLDAIKIGLSVAVGGGGLFALYLAWRRQRSNENDHEQRERVLQLQQQVAAETKAHQARVAEDMRQDALERRITELYTKAADQLGANKAPVRLAGLYALERVAQGNENQRQTIVDLLCSYLRMPYESPPQKELIRAPVAMENERENERVQELQVRLAAERILVTHLCPGLNSDAPLETFWANIDLDLTGAALFELNLRDCHVRTAVFDRAQFRGNVNFDRSIVDANGSFRHVVFANDVSFEEAQFGGYESVSFDSAWFGGVAYFVGARFNRGASFNSAQLDKEALFNDVHSKGMSFDESNFSKNVEFVGIRSTWITFDRAQFCQNAIFDGAQFVLAHFNSVQVGGETSFRSARFGDAGEFVQFYEAKFLGNVQFDDVKFVGDLTFGRTRFAEHVSFDKAQFDNGAGFHDVHFDGVAWFEGALFGGRAIFDDARFSSDTNFERTQFAEPPSCDQARVRVDMPNVEQYWPNSWCIVIPAVLEDGHITDKNGQWARIFQRQ